MPVRESLANGAYQVIESLGEGGFGETFIAPSRVAAARIDDGSLDWFVRRALETVEPESP
jgi:hypothetical protein